MRHGRVKPLRQKHRRLARLVQFSLTNFESEAQEPCANVKGSAWSGNVTPAQCATFPAGTSSRKPNMRTGGLPLIVTRNNNHVPVVLAAVNLDGPRAPWRLLLRFGPVGTKLRNMDFWSFERLICRIAPDFRAESDAGYRMPCGN